MNLLDLVDEVVRDSADAEAFVEPNASGSRRITFGDWAAAADGVARALVERGVTKGDVVAIALPNCIDYAIAYQGILRAGAIATGINPRLGRSEVDHIVRRCAPTLVLDGPLPTAGDGDPFARHVELDDTDPVAIVWTGGTTGMPKGAWFDHACLRAMADGAAPLSTIGDRKLSPLPFAHVGYMTRMWDELVHRIATVIVPTPWTATAAVELIERERVTVCQGVPTQYRLMLDHPALASCDTSGLRIAATGAARVPPELVTEIGDRLGCPVVVRYASTEASLATGTRLGDPVDVVCTTVGRPSGGVELRVVGDDGSVAPPGAVGTIRLRSRAMMRGYWNDPDQTASAIDRDGWLRTGDLGWVGDDGNLRLAGRTSEMYIRGGYNVYPIEVENCLGAHPALAASAVLGADVDDRLGEIGVLFAVPRGGFAVELDDVRTFVAERLAGYKAPDILVLVESLPLTTIGKVDKLALREQADQEAARWRRVPT
jgi:acyl-CoA synthetase (AMP-forming)/AMP-acid ligase II